MWQNNQRETISHGIERGTAFGKKTTQKMPGQVVRVTNCVGIRLSSTATDDEFPPEAEKGRHLELMCKESPFLGLGKSTLKQFVLF